MPDEPQAHAFYTIIPRPGGTADIILRPPFPYDTRARVIRGVVLYDGLEADIRMRYDSWCESAKLLESEVAL